MTNEELIAKIKDFANEQKELLNGFELQSDFRRGGTAAYSAIISFLDTLESEKTISPWKKIHTYTEEIHEGDMEKMLLELSVGKGEKRTKTALQGRIVDILESEKPVPADLEKAAKEYVKDIPTFKDSCLMKAAFEDGGFLARSRCSRRRWKVKSFSCLTAMWQLI